MAFEHLDVATDGYRDPADLEPPPQRAKAFGTKVREFMNDLCGLDQSRFIKRLRSVL
jgi:hypothetical protein